MLRVFQSVRGLSDDSVTRLDKNEDLALEMRDLTELHWARNFVRSKGDFQRRQHRSSRLRSRLAWRISGLIHGVWGLWTTVLDLIGAWMSSVVGGFDWGMDVVGVHQYSRSRSCLLVVVFPSPSSSMSSVTNWESSSLKCPSSCFSSSMDDTAFLVYEREAHPKSLKGLPFEALPLEGLPSLKRLSTLKRLPSIKRFQSLKGLSMKGLSSEEIFSSRGHAKL